MNKLSIKVFLLVVCVVASMNTFAQKKNKKGKKEVMAANVEKPLSLANRVDSVSYGVGLNVALNLKRDFNEANVDALILGLKDGLENDSTMISADIMQQVVMTYFKEKSDKKAKEELKEVEKIAQAGTAFLEENKTKEGVQVTESGLQYIVLKEGTGKQPVAASSVTVHYQGTTPEGEIFDSSINRGKPATFGLQQVIKGWTEGLQLMKEGAKYRFFIPQQLAYGSNPPQNGAGLIKKFMPLVFEVELIKVND